MPRWISLPSAALLLAPALALSACQPVIGMLEVAAQRHNAQEATLSVDRTAGEADAASSTAGAAPDPEAGAPTGGAADPQAFSDAGSASEAASEAAATAQPYDAAPRERPGVVFAAPLPSHTPPPTSTPDPFLDAGDPVRLEIPAILVDANIEAVGLTDQNAMDVPKGWMNAGWYAKGFRPGEPGNAVIAGHLDSNTGGPAVFWSLHDLAPGDEVFVTYSSGLRLQFQVNGNQIYDYDADGPIIETIFGPGQTADLNLITCKGSWDYGNATYSKRLVVFTTLVGEAPAEAVGQ